ncbi:MAG: hypothetical protein A3A51_04385 [Candidatus Levybacteria bacterium RIFCSPLOWO2_01_FULL_39_10]|nr:MAG: hypothetical protein A3A51_04385 [Candidatus Levybacteria bacterium RIFCSPLOWO2_01_FULL_39_10]
MELIKKHKLIFGIIAVQLIVLPLLLLLVRQQQETRTGAVAATTLSFLPNSGATSPINANINQEFTVDLMLNPGTNLVSLAKLDITYDPTVIALSSSTPVVVNSTAFPVIVEGPIYTNGRVQIVVSVGSDQTKVIQTTTKVLTIKFRGTSASQTQIGFGTNNAIYSIAPQDSSTENVLSTTMQAYVKINAAPTNTPTPTPTVTPTPTNTPTPTPTPIPTSTPTPTPIVDPKISASPTTVAGGGTVNVSVRNGPGNLEDWVGLYRVGDAGFDWIEYQYLGGSDVPPPQALRNADLVFTMPQTAGQYEFRLFENDTFNVLATSQVVTVTAPATPTLTPTATPVPKTVINFDGLKLHGIGSGGDNPNPSSLGNLNPLHPTRALTVEIYNTSGTLIVSLPSSINYNGATTGDFSGSVELPSAFSSGTYIVKVKSPQYLKKQIPGFVDITSGQSHSAAQVALVSGDVNNDNQLTNADYDIIMGCYSDLQPAKNCDATRKAAADLSDDGKVNHDDYNLFMREISVQNGS